MRLNSNGPSAFCVSDSRVKIIDLKLGSVYPRKYSVPNVRVFGVFLEGGLIQKAICQRRGSTILPRYQDQWNLLIQSPDESHLMASAPPSKTPQNPDLWGTHPRHSHYQPIRTLGAHRNTRECGARSQKRVCKVMRVCDANFYMLVPLP